MEDDDFIDVEYSTDGGDSFTLIEDWDGASTGNTLNGNFDSETVTQDNLSGTLVVRVTMDNNSGTETFRMDDVEVTSSTTDPIVQFTSKSESVPEGNSVTLTAELLNAPSAEVSADVEFSGGSSTAESGDMSATSKNITFSAGADDGATRKVSFSVLQDTDTEGPETAVYALKNVSGGSAKTAGTSEFDIEIPSEDLSIPLTEDFDGDPLFGFTIGTDARDETDNYFTLDNGDNINKIYTGVSGTFFAGQDIDDDQVLGSTPGQLTWSDIDITGASNLSFSGKFAEVLDGSGDIDESDFLTVEYRIDGGSWQELIDFHGSGSNAEFKEDTNSDGVGDGTSISSSSGSMVSFTKAISGTGSTLDLRFTASVDAGNEDFAVEDFEITGNVSPVVRFTAASGTVQESDGSTTLALEILNPPSGTQVTANVAFNSGSSEAESGDVNSFGTKSVTFPSSPTEGETETVTVNLNSDDNEEGSEDAVFDLQNVQNAGAVAGSPNQFTLAIQDGVGDHSGDVLITELMPDPDAVNDSEGEYLELYNSTSNDKNIDGWQVDGSNISNVTVPSRGFVVLCKNSDESANGGIDCDGEVSFTLTNGGEQVELLDGGDTQVDVVDYSGSNFPTVPTGSSLILTETSDNNDGNNWAVATRRERGYAQDQSGDNGSPGRNGTGQTLQPTTEISGGAGWRMLSAPVGGVTPKDLADVSLVQGVSGLPFSGAASNLYQWPGGPDDQNTDWTTPSSATTELTSSGQGFIWYVFDAAKTEFTDTPPFTLSVPGTPRTDQVTNSGLGEGFHLVGNPYAQAIDPASVDFGGQGFQTTVQIYDPSAGGYETITVPYTAENLIGPYQGFFVERGSGNGQLDFDPGDRVADPISLKSIEGAPPRIEFQLVGRNGEGSVLTRDEALTLHAPEGATTDWDVHDASKLTPLSGLSGRYLTAAFRDSSGSDVRLQSVMSIPQSLPPGGLELPVSLQMQAADSVDTVRLSWTAFRNVPDAWGLALYDSAADSTVNLRTNSSYSFSLSTSKAQSAPAPRSPLALPTPLRAKAQSDSARFVLTVQPTPIPVELASFEATASGSAAQLTWATASETNNAGFHIERRGPESDGFASMGFVEGHGTTTQPQRYRYRTRSLGPGRHVFRLRQVDLDGSETRSDTVSVRLRLAEAATMAVAPNPVQTRATATLRVRTEQSVTVALYDVLGRRVRTVHEGPLAPNRAHTLRIDADALSSGLYLLRANGERFQETRRVTVVR